jgi:carbamate kinase
VAHETSSRTDPKIAVVALGGNAILDPQEKNSFELQKQALAKVSEQLFHLISQGYRLVITHGNGPQVGNLILGMDAALHQFNLPISPLDQCVAMTQGSIGYLLENSLSNTIAKYHQRIRVISLLTSVEVSKDDPAFQNPVKAIGPILEEAQYQKLKNSTNWTFKELGEQRYRRVVPSPEPKNIFIKDLIQEFLDKGYVCIASGGGGIPLYQENDQCYPLEAVIDKDLTSSLLARQINADLFLIATAVKKVCIHYKKPQQRELDRVSLPELIKYIEEGHFGKGDMFPKVLAIRKFLEVHPDKEAYIFHLNDFANFRTSGTCFYSK